MFELFDNVWVVDFEFREEDGELPDPWCAVGYNLRTREFREWKFSDSSPQVVYTTGKNDLFVAYAAEAEGKCIRRLGWPMPVHCIDLLPLFRSYRNVTDQTPRARLLDALTFFHLPGMASAKKDLYRQLAIRGAPFSGEEMTDLVAYCREDVLATTRLLKTMWDRLSLAKRTTLAHALLMGRYSMAVSAMQTTGIPVDAASLRRIADNQGLIRQSLIRAVDARYGVFDGETFKTALFHRYLLQNRIPWPTTLKGQLKLDDDTFKSQVARHPQLEELRELRKTVAKARNRSLPVGKDGRNRASLMPFATRTGRNQPSTTKFIFSWPKWVRHLIEPPPGKALVMLDYEQEEFLIGGVLARDTNMIGAYESGDPYLQTAILAGAVPKGATKAEYPLVRAQFKTAVLGLQYGCGAESLGASLGDFARAQQLISAHRRVYRRYHDWTIQKVDTILLGGELTTPLGWKVRGIASNEPPNLRSIANWPVQATGADILRVAAIALVEHGFEVAAPIHDAILLVASEDEAEDVAGAAAEIMKEASAVVLGGIPCKVEWKITLPGQGFCGEPEPEMLRKVRKILGEGAAS